MSAKQTPRAISGAIIESGRIYTAGDEDAFASIMQGKSVSHLVEKGVITGDWGSSEGPQSEDELDAPADETETEQPLPKLADMAEHLAGLSTIEDVQAMQARDERAGAVKHYEARLAELAPESEE